MNCSHIFAALSLCMIHPTAASERKPVQEKTHVLLPNELAITRTRIEHPWNPPSTGPEYVYAEDELERAIVNNDFKHAIYFCNQGAKVNWPYESGNALHMLYRCVARDFSNFAILLLWANADPDAKNAQGNKPEDLLKYAAPRQVPYFQVLPTAVSQVKQQMHTTLCIRPETTQQATDPIDEQFQLVERLDERFDEAYLPLIKACADQLLQKEPKKTKQATHRK